MAVRTKEAELIEWLLDKPPEMSHIFQLRAALRVLPLLNLGFGSNYHKEWIDDLNLRFLVLGLAWIRTVLPAKCFALTSASEIITLHGNPLDFPFSATIASIDELMRSRNKLTEILVRDIDGILAASEAARLFGAKDGFDSKIFYSSPIDTRIEKFEDDFWYCIDYDKRRIDRGLNSKELAKLSIWSVKSHLSLAIEGEWNSLKRTLEPENPNLVNWFQWYEMVSNGLTPHSIESWLIDENSEFVFTDENWQKRVRQSIELTMMRVDPEQGELIPDQIENSVPENIVIPPPRPAAIEPKPIAGLASAFNYSLNAVGKITAEPGDLAKLGVDFPISRDDFSKQVKTYKKLVRNLIKSLEEKKYNCRAEYLDCLRSAEEEFGDNEEFDNFAMVDAEMRTLIELWKEDHLPSGLKVRLTTLVQQHFGIRAFYPNMYGFYQAINQGGLDEIAPIDAIIGFKAAISEELSDILDDESKMSFAFTKDDKRQALSDKVVDDYVSRDFAGEPNIETNVPKDPLGEPDSIDYWARFNAVNFNNLLTLLDNSTNLLNKGGTFFEATDKLIRRVKPLWPLIRNWLSPDQ